MRRRERNEALKTTGRDDMTGRHWLMISSSCRYLFSKQASLDFHIAPPSPCLNFRLSSLAEHLSCVIRSSQPKRHQRFYGSSLTLFLTLDLRQLLSAFIVSVPTTVLGSFDDVLQLLGKILARIIVVPALLPQMRRPALLPRRHFALLRCPICGIPISTLSSTLLSHTSK